MVNSNALLEIKSILTNAILYLILSELHYMTLVSHSDWLFTIMLPSSQQSSSEKDVENQTDTQKDPACTSRAMCSQGYSRYTGKSDFGQAFFSHKSCYQLHTHSQPICILSFLMLELFQVRMKAPNCVKSSLELIHFTARMKKLLKCQQSTKCPSHTSSWELNKTDGEFQHKELSAFSFSCM